MSYPRVLNELDTLRRVVAGASIARYGDGEFKMAVHGAGIKSQEAHRGLSDRLRQILVTQSECLIGIPNIHDVMARPEALDQKRTFWAPFVKYAGELNPSMRYVSSFISRPDSAPWINTDEYWSLLESLWLGQDVTVVRGSGKSLAPSDLHGAGEITDILCRKQHAFQDYAQILDRIGTPKRALICLGPTATVLAYDLCQRGVHAVDLGHVAMFLRKRRRGDSMVVTDTDKAHDRREGQPA